MHEETKLSCRGFSPPGLPLRPPVSLTTSQRRPNAAQYLPRGVTPARLPPDCNVVLAPLPARKAHAPALLPQSCRVLFRLDAGALPSLFRSLSTNKLTIINIYHFSIIHHSSISYCSSFLDAHIHQINIACLVQQVFAVRPGYSSPISCLLFWFWADGLIVCLLLCCLYRSRPHTPPPPPQSTHIAYYHTVSHPHTPQPTTTAVGLKARV